MFDLFFMSYDEPEADKNFDRLKKKIPHAKRVHGVEGIARAWVTAAHRAETSHFYTMDGDSQLLPDFDLNLVDFKGRDDKRVHVFRCKNRVNGLVYGYGSVHCFHTEHVRNFKNLDVVDFTLSVATEGFCIQPAVVSQTCFNTSPYISFKSGFREASKLASATNAYAGSKPDFRTHERLKAWTSLGLDESYGDWVILGARLGAIHGFKYKNDPDKLALISDHQWFRGLFNEYVDSNPRDLFQETKDTLEKFDFYVETFSERQSRYVKGMLYSV